jgi:hypothetical protein
MALMRPLVADTPGGDSCRACAGTGLIQRRWLRAPGISRLRKCRPVRWDEPEVDDPADGRLGWTLPEL